MKGLNEEYVKFDEIFKVTYKNRDDAVRKITELNKKRLNEQKILFH